MTCRQRSRIRLVAAPLLLAGVGASTCTRLPPNQEVDARPLPIVEAKSGRSVSPVLLIPQYMTTTGVSTGAGHGPGATIPTTFFLAYPRIYEQGQAFELTLPDSRGFEIVGAFFAGRGVSVKGVAVFARGYQPTWFFRLSQRPRGFELVLTPGAVEDVDSRMRDLLARDRIRGSDLTDAERLGLSISHDSEADLRFTENDKAVIRRFFSH